MLHVVNSLGFGGAERLVLSAARGLPAERFENAICCLVERGAFADEADAAGVPVWCAGGFPGFRHPWVFARLLQIIRAFRPAIVHTHLQSANLYGRLAARMAGVPIVVATEHNVYTAKPRRYILVERLQAGSTQAIVAVSEQVRTFLGEQLRVAPSSIRLIRNGVARARPRPEGVADFRRRLAVPPGTAVIGTIASLTPKKGHVFLLHALKRLLDRRIPCVLVLAGDGIQRESLASLAERLRVADAVRFLGEVRNVADLLETIDVFVLPSLVEGLPLALLEAMLAGKPVVATSVGGVPEIVTADNGVLVEPGSGDALATAIERLIASPDLARRLGERARATIERGYLDDDYVRALSDLYTELVTATA